MKLSDRLQAVASFVTPGLKVVDIGTDHGYVPIYLIKEKISSYVIAMDINKGPILRAKAHIMEEGLTEYIDTRISDGFEKIHIGEAKSAIIAGMGGELIIKILENGREIVEDLDELILSPHSEIASVREYLHKNNLKIEDEKMLIDEEKFYTIMKVTKGKDKAYSLEEYKYGAILIDRKDEVLMKYLKKEMEKLDKIITNLENNSSCNNKARLEELKDEKKMALCVIEKMEA